MVLLELLTLGTAAWGLADYRHTKIYQEQIRVLKNEYGEHPDIDEIFEDLCYVAGERYSLPEIDLNPKNPRINMGKQFNRDAHSAALVLKEFFITQDEYNYFLDKYDEEFHKQINTRNNVTKKLHTPIAQLYRKGELNNLGSTKIKNRRFMSSPKIAKNEEHYKEILNDVCHNTIWGEIFEIGPANIKFIGGYEYISEWLIKEEVIKEINTKEVFDMLFDASYYNTKLNHF